MFSAYVKNMNNQNKLNLTLSNKTVMENISFSVKTRKKGHIMPALYRTSDNAICYEDELCSAQISVNHTKNSISVGFACSVKDDKSSLPDSFDGYNTVMIEFSAPQANVSLAKRMNDGNCFASFNNFNSIPDNTVDLISKCDGGFIHYKPINGKNYSAYLKGMGTHAALIITIGCSGYNKISGDVLSITYSNDCFDLLSKQGDSNPLYFDINNRLGFYTGNLSADEIIRRTDIYYNHKIPVKIAVFDLYHKKPTLDDIRADASRFPNGLAELVKALKNKGIEHVGVRYPLGLATRGIEENSEAHSLLSAHLIKTHGDYILPKPNSADAQAVYDTINKYLKQCGISFAVICKQDHLYGCFDGFISRSEVANVYTDAFNKSAKLHFGKLLFGTDSPLLNSNIKPKIINDAYLSAFDNAQRDRFSLSDFSSKQSTVFYTVSGSNLFLNDLPNADISSLLTQNGSAIRCDGKMSVCRRNMFSDPSCDGKILRVFNHSNGSGVIAAFNVSEKGETVKGDVSPSDVEGLEGNKFICRITKENKFIVVGKDARIPISLSKNDAELIIFTPITDGFAFIGNIDKLLPPATFSVQGNEYHLCDKGYVAFYSDYGFNSDCVFKKSGNIYVAHCDTTRFNLEILK